MYWDKEIFSIILRSAIYISEIMIIICIRVVKQRFDYPILQY